VIHTVGPVWKGGRANEDELLISCYRSAFKLAAEYQLRSIAFPAISTGVYRFPFERASNIALKVVADEIEKNDQIISAKLVCFSYSDAETMKKIASGF
jgi:O-acetyl-ADP-ribose deacetylase (regulator of RNase III)